MQLDEQLIRIEMPAVEDRPHVMVVDDEQVADGPERPSKPSGFDGDEPPRRGASPSIVSTSALRFLMKEMRSGSSPV
jgi:hypothetical protein